MWPPPAFRTAPVPRATPGPKAAPMPKAAPKTKATGVHLELHSYDHFSASDIPALMPMFRTISGARLDAKERRWVLPLPAYQDVCKASRPAASCQHPYA